MLVLRQAKYRRMPWKNGGGETVEVLVHPDRAVLSDFDWRISIASVAIDGPFSLFPGIDRTLSVLHGEGFTLDIRRKGTYLMTSGSDPLTVPADISAAAKLIDGPTTDLNVMSRRGVYEHVVESSACNGSTSIVTSDAETTVLLCVEGGLRARGHNQDCVLCVLDALRVDRAASIQVEGQGKLFVIRLKKMK